jgi:FG-GAP-like repeat
MPLPFALLLGVFLAAAQTDGPEMPRWVHLSSKSRDLPEPSTSTQQTGCLVLDIDQDGLNDIVVTSRAAGASMVWYRRGERGWTIHPIDSGLNIEAGGTYADIDADADLDLVFGEDYTGSKLYWWENPYPNYAAKRHWTRREIKKTGDKMHHDQIFGDFAGDGTNKLAFWVQRSEIVWLASIPSDPKQLSPWPTTPLARVGPAEGLAKADIDGDGKLDLIGGGFWFKHLGARAFQPMLIDKKSLNSRAAAGQLVEGDSPEVVFVVGDGVGRLKWLERSRGNWVSHDLLGEDVVHGHSLELADIDQDGHLDIFCAEMAQWTEGTNTPDNPGARMWIFYGDGHGRFTKTLLARGIDNHESRVSDLDGDGDMDIVVKPYTHDTPRLDIWLNDGTGPRKKSAKSTR